MSSQHYPLTADVPGVSWPPSGYIFLTKQLFLDSSCLCLEWCCCLSVISPEPGEVGSHCASCCVDKQFGAGSVNVKERESHQDEERNKHGEVNI